MRRILLPVGYFLLGLLVLAGIVISTLFAAGAGTDAVAVVGLAFGILASVGVAASFFFLWHTDHQQGDLLSEMRELKRTTQAAIDDARARVPQPTVKFQPTSSDEASSKRTWIREPIERALEIEDILSDERKHALATLPPQKPRDAGRLGARGVQVGGGLRAVLGHQDPGPPIDESQRKEFERTVDAYLSNLRKWLEAYEPWRRTRDDVLYFRLLFVNDGQVPAIDAQLNLHLPTPFEPVDENAANASWPEAFPDRPKFRRRWSLDNARRHPSFDISRLLIGRDRSSLERYTKAIAESRRPAPPTPNVSKPKYREGSVDVEINITKLRHWRPEESAPVQVQAGEDGDYEATWTIHAENLLEPATGILYIGVETHPVGGEPITSLDGLLESDPMLVKWFEILKEDREAK